MRLHSKVIAATISTAIAVSAISAPAAAQQNQQQRTTILPTLVGPIGAAALFPATNTFHWSTTLFKSYNFGWSWTNPIHAVTKGVHPTLNAVEKAIHLHKHGFDVTKTLDTTGSIKKGSANWNVDGKKNVKHSRTSKTVGKAVVGCIFGSALATIAASVRKASAMGNPPRWRSQAEHEKILASGVEKKYELTLAEANTAMAFCGLGSFTLNWPNQRP
jgi:hypothetical protein